MLNKEQTRAQINRKRSRSKKKPKNLKEMFEEMVECTAENTNGTVDIAIRGGNQYGKIWFKNTLLKKI